SACAEAEHILNVPMLIGETNIDRHMCYVNTDRKTYATWIQANCDQPEADQGVGTFRGSWKKLDEVLTRGTDNAVEDKREINEIYLSILRIGLARTREAAASDDAKLAAMDSDHVHNLPSLIDETNIHRHLYYLNGERTLYKDRVFAHLGKKRAAPRFIELLKLWQNLNSVIRSMVDDEIERRNQ
ncbi:MAG: hypothetical protein N2C14_06015, partial [Planctomycetales bacterium]